MKRSCGTDGKECAVCCYGDGCVATMLEDLYAPATQEQIIDRLNQREYPRFRQLMIDTLKREFGCIYEEKECKDTTECIQQLTNLPNVRMIYEELHGWRLETKESKNDNT